MTRVPAPTHRSCQTVPMRRSALAALAASILVFLPVSPALAAPSPSAAAGKPVCSVSDSRLTNITGIAATSSGYVVARSDAQTSAYKLGSNCKITSTLSYSPRALSPQDVTVRSDGTIWVADTGLTNNNANRPRIALWKFSPNSSQGTIFRFKYPGGAQLDSHAMVMTGAGVPVFITMVDSGPATLYTPAAALDPKGGEVPLKKVGQFTPQHTGTSNALGAAANNVVTGGATSPDGSKVVLRTYSDAYEWSVKNGDVVAAITGSAKPLVTPLPDEASGEAITFSADGKSFVTASGAPGEKASFLKYTPSTGSKTSTASTGGSSNSSSGSSTWWDKLSLTQIAYLVGAIGVIGLLMVVGGVVGIRNARKQKQLQALASPGPALPGRASVPGLPPVPPQAERRYDQYGGEQQYGEPYGDQQYGAEQPPYDAQQQYGSGQTYGGGGQQYGSGQTYGGEQQYDPYANQYGGGTYGSEQAPQQNRGGRGGRYDAPASRHPRDEEQYQDGYGAPYNQQPNQGGGTYGSPRQAPPRPPAGRGGYPDDQENYGDWR